MIVSASIRLYGLGRHFCSQRFAVGRAPVPVFALLIAIVCLVSASSLAAGRKSGYALDSATCGSGSLSFPKIQLDMMKGFCAGLVASEDDGLKFPRSIVQVPDRELFVVADMVGWGHIDGKLLLLDPNAAEGRRLKPIITGLEYPFGLAVGSDKKIYAATAETIFRFDPLANDPRSTIETIVKGLPGRKQALADGSTINEASHPLKQFVFDKTGRLFVNVGSHSDNCITQAPISNPCRDGEGAASLASIWMFTPPAGSVFPALKPSDGRPPHEVYARGLRNSMALAVHPRFPEPGFAFLQGENSRDLQDIFSPNEEINALEQGKHYGWPYCYDLATPSPEFRAVLQAGTYKDFCSNISAYKQPLSLLPPHGAPLAMLYYNGSKFPELARKLLISLHGYRPTGSRLLAYDVDERGFPKVSPPPVRYRVNCGAEPTRAFQSGNADAAAAPYDELISGWYRVNGKRPRGAPVGLTVASDGAIWLIEDKNQTIIRIDRTSDEAAEPLACDTRTQTQIGQLVGFVLRDPQNKQVLSAIRKGLVEKHCMGCHSDFGLSPGQPDAAKDEIALRYMLSQDGWIYPGDPESGKLRARLRGLGAERLMPPGGENLPRTEPGYVQLLNYVDSLVGKMVPGTRMRIKPGPPERKFFSRSGKECGEIPSGKIVVVTQRIASDKPGFSRFYRPADFLLNGECNDDDGYYIRQDLLAPL